MTASRARAQEPALPPQAPPAIRDPSRATPNSAAPAGTPLDEKGVRKVIADVLREQDDQKKQAEDQKRIDDATVGVEVGTETKTISHWRDGLHWETADGAYKFYVGGRVDFDNTWYASPHSVSNSIGQFNNFFDPNLGLTDGSDFRRARLRFQGTIYEVVEFVSEYDFANFIDVRRRTLGIAPPAGAAATAGDFDPVPGTRFTDVWLGINQIPWLGTFRAGHQKEWITFQNATSGRFLTFMERPANFDAFNNDFQFSNGFTLQNTYLSERAYWWVGFFRNNTNVGAFDVGDGDYAYDVRLTFLPVWRDDGNLWVHVGADYSYRNLHQDQTRFRARPMELSGEQFQQPNVVNTGTIFSRDAQQLVNLEYASAWGPLTLTGEYTWVRVGNAFTGGLPNPNGTLPAGVVRRGNYTAEGWYVEALYFLTGDHRGYRREQPGYDRIQPATNFFFVRGPGCWPIFGTGAWEVGVRYDHLDLTNHGINGGIYDAVTGGINWHLNPNAKIQWNLSYMVRNFEPTDFAGRQKGNFWGFGTRFHWDF
jgi:phosphate-selective porin OprO/OprP